MSKRFTDFKNTSIGFNFIDSNYSPKINFDFYNL